MNKWQKMFSFVLIVCLVLMIHGIIIPKHCSGEDYFEDYTIKPEENLISDYNLSNTDKIIIETRKKYTFKPYQYLVITDQDTIQTIIDGLKNSKINEGIQLGTDYIISFWRGDKKLLTAQLAIVLDNPKISILRHTTEDPFVYTYYISRTLHDFFVSILHLEAES